MPCAKIGHACTKIEHIMFANRTWNLLHFGQCCCNFVVSFYKVENEESIALLKEISRDLKKLVGLLGAGQSTGPEHTSLHSDLPQIHLPTSRTMTPPKQYDPALWQPAWKVRNLLGISRTTLYRHTKKKRLIHDRFGGQLFYLTSEIFKIQDHYLK